MSLVSLSQRTNAAIATPMPTATARPTAQSFYELGQENLADGEIDDARAKLTRAIEPNPQFTEAYFLIE